MLFENTNPNDPFIGAVIVTKATVGDRSRPSESLPYISEKPGGTDVGHVISLNGKPVLVKIGITSSLLMQAVEKYLLARQGSEKEWQICMARIIGNFTRPTTPPAPENESETDKKKREDANKARETALKEKLIDKFQVFCKSSEGIQFLNQIMEDRKRAIAENKPLHQTLTTSQVYALAQKIFSTDPELHQVFAYAAFADQMCAFGQILCNDFMQSINPGITIAKHQLLATTTEPGLYQVSTLVPEAQSLQDFLLDCFAIPKEEGAKNEDWIKRGRANLEAKLNNKPIKGLCAAIVFKWLMGEVGDINWKNMLIIEKPNQFEIISIDGSGPRYSRQKPFIVNDQVRSLGWEETLKATDMDTVTKNLFDSSVLSFEGMKDFPRLEADDATRKLIFAEIISVLKQATQTSLPAEFIAAKNWLANLDAQATVAQISNQINYVHENLHPNLKPENNLRDSYLTYFSGFVIAPCEVVNKQLEQGAAPASPAL